MNQSAALTGAFIGVSLALLIGLPAAMMLPGVTPDERGFNDRTWYFAGKTYDTASMVALVQQSKARNPGYSFGLLCTNPDTHPMGVSGILTDEVRGVDRELTKFELVHAHAHPTATDNRVCNAMIARIKQ